MYLNKKDLKTKFPTHNICIEECSAVYAPSKISEDRKGLLFFDRTSTPWMWVVGAEFSLMASPADFFLINERKCNVCCRGFSCYSDRSLQRINLMIDSFCGVCAVTREHLALSDDAHHIVLYAHSSSYHISGKFSTITISSKVRNLIDWTKFLTEHPDVMGISMPNPQTTCLLWVTTTQEKVDALAYTTFQILHYLKGTVNEDRRNNRLEEV